VGSPMTRTSGSVAKRGFSRGPKVVLAAIAALLLVALIAYFGISVVVADKLSRPDRHALTYSPSDFGLSYQHVQFTSSVDRIPLDGWYIDSPGSKVILMLHGRNGLRDDPTLNLIGLIQALVQNGYDVFTFDFRGHGLSGGERYSFGDLERRDIDGALAYLKTRGVNEVGVIAFSMGAATALNSAPDHPEMRAIVADSSFADLNLLLETGLPNASGLPAFFNPGILFMARVMYGMDLPGVKPANALARLGNRPVFLIHGTGDPMVPMVHHELLLKAAVGNPNVESWVVPGADHAQSYKQEPEEYLRRVIAFFKKNWQ
jgi:alpha-beta hydrolase superfamily lysophospholipase